MGWSDWPRGPEIEPSIYAADFARLGEQLAELLDAGAKIFQFDVGDGHFVEPITIGPIVLQAISPLFRERGGILDVHLMTEHPHKHFEAFAKAGADSVTVHYEVVGGELPAVEAQARELGMAFGVAFNPESTPRRWPPRPAAPTSCSAWASTRATRASRTSLRRPAECSASAGCSRPRFRSRSTAVSGSRTSPS